MKTSLDQALENIKHLNSTELIIFLHDIEAVKRNIRKLRKCTNVPYMRETEKLYCDIKKMEEAAYVYYNK